MKRVPEFVCGLIGAVLAFLISGFFFIVAASLPSYYGVDLTFISNGFGLLVSIGAIVCAVLVNKHTKICSIVLIVAAVVLLLTNLFQLIPFALLLTSGIMGLVRKID